jgi:flagellar biosynthesis/type III secretory pathway protein FliH
MDDELKNYLEGMEARIKAELTEVMRDMQTELLRGFANHSAGMTLRVRKIEADQSSLDASLSGRVEVLEKRLGEIEQRLWRA